MTEKQPNNFEDIVAHFENTFDKGDPVVNNILSRAHEMQAEVNKSIQETGQVNETMCRMYLDELIKMWPYQKTLVDVTGKIFYPSDEGRPAFEIVDSEQMLSHGFTFVVERDQDNPNIPDVKIAYTMTRRGGKPAACYLDNVVIDYPFVSEEYSENRLRLYCPDVLARADEILKSDDSVEIVKSLKGFSADTSSTNEIYDIDTLATDLSRYISQKINFDSDMPYFFEHQGSLVLVKDNSEPEPHNTHSTNHYAGIAKGIFMAPLLETSTAGDETESIIAYVRLDYYGTDKNLPAVQLMLPVDNISHVESVRESLYRNS